MRTMLYKKALPQTDISIIFPSCRTSQEKISLTKVFALPPRRAEAFEVVPADKRGCRPIHRGQVGLFVNLQMIDVEKGTPHAVHVHTVDVGLSLGVSPCVERVVRILRVDDGYVVGQSDVCAENQIEGFYFNVGVKMRNLPSCVHSPRPSCRLR